MKNALIQIIKTTDSIEELRDSMCLDTLPGHITSMIITNPNGSHTIQHVFDRTFVAGEPCASQRAAEVYGLDDEEDIPVLDIDKSDWESIKKAADESSWIPKEHYFQNDWVADVCRYLREGHPKPTIMESLMNDIRSGKISIEEAQRQDRTPGIHTIEFHVWPDGSWVCVEDMDYIPEDYSDDFTVIEVPEVVCEASYDCIDAYIKAKMPKLKGDKS